MEKHLPLSSGIFIAHFHSQCSCSHAFCSHLTQTLLYGDCQGFLSLLLTGLFFLIVATWMELIFCDFGVTFFTWRGKKIHIYFEADLQAGEIFSRMRECWLESIITWLTCFGKQIDLGTLQCLEKHTRPHKVGILLMCTHLIWKTQCLIDLYLQW